MPTSRRWIRGMNLVFVARCPPCGLTAVAADARVVEPRLKTVTAVPAVNVEEEEELDRACDHGFSREQAAAATIQARFRGHLARRAFRALRSLVKMQAFARGSYVRKQADVAIRCMKVFVRLQVRVRARRLIDMSKSKDQ